MSPRLALALASSAALVAAAPAAHAGPGSGPTAAVSLGDSYISGEAGRWQGNSIDPTPGHSGTDRACSASGPGCEADRSRVYVGGSAANGCHRSDVAEIHSAQLAVQERVNIACSGAQTKHVFRKSAGGEGPKGEAPQADQLLDVARAKDVKLVVMTIGGNDLGFASIVAACLQAFAIQTGPCNPGQQAVIDQNLAKATEGVGKAIQEVRAVMAEAGYGSGDYRLIVQTYPSVVPRAAEARYPESAERDVHNCPFYDADLNWARDHAAPQIGAMVKRAAALERVEVIDLIDLLQGHEFCSKSTQEATPLAPPSPETSDWGRFVGASSISQGATQESFHPNAYGQQAIGACLTQVAAATPGTFVCAGRAGIAPGAVEVTRQGTLTPGQVRARAPRLRLAVARRARGCVTFRVSAAGRAIARATVRFAGRRARTSRRGRATFCRVRAGRRTALATHPAYRSARRTVATRRR